MNGSDTKTRLTMRVPSRMRATLEDAADLSGASVNHFVLHAALKEAQRMLESETVVRLSARQARKMAELIDDPPPATKRVRAALKDFKKNVRV